MTQPLHSIRIAAIALGSLCAITAGCATAARLRAQVPASSMVTPPPLMKRQILNAVDAGDGDVLVRNLRRSIVEQPDRLDLRLELVNHFESLGEGGLVTEHLRLLVERFPAHEDLSLRLARTLRRDGSPDEALRILRNLTSRQTVESPAVWSLTGILLDELARPMEGEAEHRRALALARENVDVYENNLGFNLLAQGRAEEAVALFESALARRPRSEVARNNLGAALAAGSRSATDKDAILKHWMSVNDPASAHNNLGAALIEQGRYAEARVQLQESLRLRADLPAAWKNLQLVSELDGQPVTISSRNQPASQATKSAAPANVSGLRKVWHGVRATFISDEPVLKPSRSTRAAR